jgi:drug/metabolite transporter (DMT)-like permease
MFGLLGLIWGSSFLWIKVALNEIGPFTLVSLRLLFAVFGMALVILWKRPSFPAERKTWLQLALVGTFNTAMPFVLISWGEQSIDSAMASILNGTVPLFTVVIAHLFLQDERINLPKILGLLIGFAGIIVLVQRDLGPQDLGGSFLGKSAVLVASISYAGSAVFVRRNLKQVPMLVLAFIPMLVADGIVWSFVPLVEAPFQLPSMPLTWIAVIWLGLLGSWIAYLLYFSLIQSVGPTRSVLVTYVFPVVGVILGVLFLNESLDFNLVLGSSMVVASIVVVNWQPKEGARGRGNAKTSPEAG